MRARVNLSKDRREPISKDFKLGQDQYRVSDKKSTQILFSLVSAWTSVSDPDERVYIGSKLLKLVNKSGVDDEHLAEEVLTFVGTEICNCDDDDAWDVISTFLKSDRSLSVNFASLLAGIRILRLRPDTSLYKKTIAASMDDMTRLANSMNNEVKKSAKLLIELVEKASSS